MPEILVIKPSSFGDIIHGLQVAETIRLRVPGARISWIAAEMFAPFVRACTTVSEVFAFERRGGLGGFRRLMRDVRERRFDHVLDMQGLARSGLMTFFAHGVLKVGRRDTREGAALFYNRRIALPPGGEQAHALEILLQFLPVFGCEPALAGHLSFACAHGAESEVAKKLPAGRRPLVLMFPDSRRPEKNWPHFRELTGLLLRSRSVMRVIWAGNNAATDLPDVASRDATAGSAFENLTGRTRIDELPALIAAADIVVANDSGPMHLAAAIGTRVLALFGPTDPKLFGPFPLTNPRHHVLRAPDGSLAALAPTAVAAALDSALTSAGAPP